MQCLSVPLSTLEDMEGYDSGARTRFLQGTSKRLWKLRWVDAPATLSVNCNNSISTNRKLPAG